MRHNSAVSQGLSNALRIAIIAVADRSWARYPRQGVVLFLGDSITAGYGLDLEQAYPALIQEKIDAKRWQFKVVNAGTKRRHQCRRIEPDRLAAQKSRRCSGSGARRQRRFARTTGRNHPEKPSSDHRSNKSKISGAKIVIAGMKVPPNMGARVRRTIRSDLSRAGQKKQSAADPICSRRGRRRARAQPAGRHAPDRQRPSNRRRQCMESVGTGAAKFELRIIMLARG